MCRTFHKGGGEKGRRFNLLNVVARQTIAENLFCLLARWCLYNPRENRFILFLMWSPFFLSLLLFLPRSFVSNLIQFPSCLFVFEERERKYLRNCPPFERSNLLYRFLRVASYRLYKKNIARTSARRLCLIVNYSYLFALKTRQILSDLNEDSFYFPVSSSSTPFLALFASLRASSSC